MSFFLAFSTSPVRGCSPHSGFCMVLYNHSCFCSRGWLPLCRKEPGLQRLCRVSTFLQTDVEPFVLVLSISCGRRRGMLKAFLVFAARQAELARKNVLSDTSHVGKVSLLYRSLYSRVGFLHPLLNTIPILTTLNELVTNTGNK